MGVPVWRTGEETTVVLANDTSGCGCRSRRAGILTLVLFTSDSCIHVLNRIFFRLSGRSNTARESAVILRFGQP